MTQTQNNPQYRPTRAQKRLEKEVEARRRKLLAEGRELPQTLGPKPQTPTAGDTVAEISARLHIPPPLPGMLEQWEREARDEQARWRLTQEAQYRERTFNRLCPERFREMWDWKKVKPEINTPAARKAVRLVMDWRPGPQGLYIVGATGHSKSRLVYRLVRRLVIDDRLTGIVVMDGVAFSNLMTRAFGNPDHTEAMLREIVMAPILIVDDMAKRWTPATEEGAFTVLDRRTARNLPFICTLNYTGDDFVRMQAARGDLAKARDVATPLARRLEDYCTPVVL